MKKSENLLRELTAQEPKNLAYQRDLAKLYVRFGDSEELNLNIPAALSAYQKSTELFENLVKMDDKNTLAVRDMAQSLKNVAEMQIKLNQKAEAKQTFQKTLDILNNLKSHNSLGEFDQRMINEVQTALQKL